MNELITFCILMIGAFLDFRYKKIPNFITFPCFFVGISINTINSGISWLIVVVINILVIIVLFGHGFLCGYIGGGDIKLLLAVACWIELKLLIVFVLLTLIFGAIFGVYNILRDYKSSTLHNSSAFYHIEKTVFLEKLRLKSGKKIPYAICMFIGFIATVLIM